MQPFISDAIRERFKGRSHDGEDSSRLSHPGDPIKTKAKIIHLCCHNPPVLAQDEVKYTFSHVGLGNASWKTHTHTHISGFKTHLNF